MYRQVNIFPTNYYTVTYNFNALSMLNEMSSESSFKTLEQIVTPLVPI